MTPSSNHSSKSDRERWEVLLRSLSTLSSGKGRPIYYFEKKMSDWAEEKAKFIEMPFSMKRQFYKTKNKQYVELNQIPSWEEYYRNNEARLKQQLQESKAAKTANKQFSPDVQLNKIVTLWQGDITLLEIDAIVNAANTKLLGGGGVDGAIHKAAGPSLLKECATLNGCPTGQSKITGGYCLPAKHVIHTVGPYGEKPALLKSCYKTSLELLIDNELTSIAYPCISTGVYHYPQEAAAKVALETVRDILEQNKSNVTKVIFTTFLAEDVEIYENLMQIYFPLE